MLVAKAKSFRRAVNRQMQGIFFDRLVENIRNRGEIQDTNKLFNYMARSNFGMISSIRSRAEPIPVLDLLKQNPPKTVMEIGTANGGTLFMLTRVAQPDAMIVSLDLPGGN